MTTNIQTRNALRLVSQTLESAAEATRALAAVQCHAGDPMQVWGTMQRYFALGRMVRNANRALDNARSNTSDQD